jgi:hypothetical protein
MGQGTNIAAVGSRPGLSMVSLSPDACAPSVFAINQLRRGRHGKIPMPNRLFCSIRRECVDHIVVFGEQHPSSRVAERELARPSVFRPSATSPATSP